MSERHKGIIRVADFKKREGIKDGRSIIKVEPKSSTVIRLDDDDMLDQGDRYIDVPRYKRGVLTARVESELYDIKTTFPDVDIYYDIDKQYILIDNFFYGRDYTPSRGPLLIFLPSNYPITPPGMNTDNGIYVKGGLKRHGRALSCEHDYHWQCSCNPQVMREQGYAWWCFAELSEWDPEGDSLLHIIVILYETLLNPGKKSF